MKPEEFFTLSSITSVAGAAAIVLVVTNALAMVLQRPTSFRVSAGFVIAGIVAILAMLVSPPSGGLVGEVLLWFANTCLLYVTAFGGSHLAPAAAGAVAAGGGAPFWSRW